MNPIKDIMDSQKAIISALSSIKEDVKSEVRPLVLEILKEKGLIKE